MIEQVVAWWIIRKMPFSFLNLFLLLLTMLLFYKSITTVLSSMTGNHVVIFFLPPSMVMVIAILVMIFSPSLISTFMGILKYIICKYVHIVVVGLDFVFVLYVAFLVNFVVNSVVLFVRFYLYFMLLILMLSGDVELNPGPAVQYRKKNCKVLYSNIRGLRTNFLDLQSHARSYDILFLSETLVTSNKAQSEFLLPGFDGPQFIYRRSTPNAQGMAVYSRSGLPVYWQIPWNASVMNFCVSRCIAGTIMYMCLLYTGILIMMTPSMTAFWKRLP